MYLKKKGNTEKAKRKKENGNMIRETSPFDMSLDTPKQPNNLLVAHAFARHDTFVTKQIRTFGA